MWRAGPPLSFGYGVHGGCWCPKEDDCNASRGVQPPSEPIPSLALAKPQAWPCTPMPWGTLWEGWWAPTPYTPSSLGGLGESKVDQTPSIQHWTNILELSHQATIATPTPQGLWGNGPMGEKGHGGHMPQPRWLGQSPRPWGLGGCSGSL